MTTSVGRAPACAPEKPDPPVQDVETDTTRHRRRLWMAAGLAAVIASLVAALSTPEGVLRTQGLGAFGEFFAAAARPRLDAEFLPLVLTATTTTLSYAVLGTAISLVIGLVGGVLTSETWWLATATGRRRKTSFACWALLRGLFVVPRGIHEVVWGLFFLAVFGLDSLVAVLAIGIPFGAVTAKVFSELLDETARGPFVALVATGVGRRSAMLYGLSPAAVSDLLSYGFYRFECAIRSAAILGLVGAGGLGFELSLSFQSLQYGEIWTLLYALIVLSVLADSWSSMVRRRRNTDAGMRASSTSRAGRGASTLVRASRSLFGNRDPVVVLSLLAGLGLIGFSFWWVGLSPATLFSNDTWQQGLSILGQSWPLQPPDGGLGELVRLGAVTVAVSVLATVFAFWTGTFLALPATTVPTLGLQPRHRTVLVGLRALLAMTTKLLMIVLRAIPPPVWALLLLFVFNPGILPGALALGVYTAGVLGRLMAEATQNLPGEPLRALRAHGATELQVLCYAVMPAATPRFIAYGLYRWEVAIRETVVVGVVGAGGLGLLLDHQLASFDYNGAAATLLALIVLTMIVDLASASIRRSLR